jgi:hypothetical protein
MTSVSRERVLAQLLGAAVATVLFRWLVPPTP